MRGRTYKSEGIVLQRRNYFEVDRILTVYSYY
ncbi:recombination protein O N-terminal domain-containing protein [Patescibacteria group bacterium]|nr:recombination protein O N-terminal domain-containing protein [Patescibacteria group bacterium]